MPFLIVLRADPLWMARWSVLSLWMMYCGSSLQACRLLPLKVISLVTFFWAEWRTEIAWMRLYFSVCVWGSLGLVHTPRVNHHESSPAEKKIEAFTRQRAFS